MEAVFCSENLHPRLLFTRGDVQDFCTRMQGDAKVKEEFDALLQKADALLQEEFMDEAYADSVYSQHGRYYELGGQLQKMGHTLGFAYLVTGEMRYAEKLRQAMLFYTSFEKWVGPSNKDRDTPWHSELTTTRMTEGIAVGFDCIYDILSDEEREKIAKALLRLGIEPLLTDWVLDGTRIHALDSMGHNWWAVCIALAGVGLLAVMEYEPRAQSWLAQILQALHGFCDYTGSVLLNKAPNFDDHGLFYESAGYFNYGVGELLHFAYVYRQVMRGGEADTVFSHIDRAGSAFMAMSYPTSREEAPLLFPNFGDSNLYGGFTGLPRYLLLCGYESPEMRLCYRTYQTEKDELDLLRPQVLWNAQPQGVALEQDIIFEKTGYAYLRSSWEQDATLLAVRCGYTWNHAHDDAGSYMIFDRGWPLICDSGNCSYDRSEYADYYKTCDAHNIITINGRAALPENIIRGSKFCGSFPHFVKGAGMKYLLADVTGPTCDQCSRNYRSFLQLDADTFVIVDDLLAHTEATFASLLHFYGSGTVQDNCVTVQNGHSTALVRFLFPQKLSVQTRSGYLPPEKLSNNVHSEVLPVQPYFAAVAETPTHVQQFFTVISLNDAALNTKVQSFTGENQLGARIQRDGAVYTVCYNLLADGRKMHENSNNVLLGLETDAYLLVKKEQPGQNDVYLMAYGSYLRTPGGGQVLYSSFTKDFVCR